MRVIKYLTAAADIDDLLTKLTASLNDGTLEKIELRQPKLKQSGLRAIYRGI
jgi:hypothetical protein